MKAQDSKGGDIFIDSLPLSQAGTDAQVQGLKAAGVRGVAVYLGVAKASLVASIVAAGMGCFAVTLAGAYEAGPAGTLAALKALGLPKGIHVFLDMEGKKAWDTPPDKLMAMINVWADAVRAAGYKPALYVGVPQPLTSDQLWSLHVEFYWRGQGRVVDKPSGGKTIAEPWGCGWGAFQSFPSRNLGTPPTWVDVDMVNQDYKGRVLTWAVA